MNTHVRVKTIESYRPENKINNNFFLNYYDNRGIDIRGLLNSSGRENRYISNNPEENSLTMAIEASKKALDKAHMIGSDLDLIVFVSDTPEYLAPANAIEIHKAIGGKEYAGAFDMNCNCLGMVVALDHIGNAMKVNKRLKKCLIVGTQQIQRFGMKSEPIVYANFGDLACAVILEQTDDENSNFIDSLSYTDSGLIHSVHFPKAGLSKVLPTDENISREDKCINWNICDTSRAFAPTAKHIQQILDDNGIKKSQVKKYFLSQMVKSKIDMVRLELDEPEEKFPFVGDEYGYTGTTSPLLAMQHSIEKNELQHGDYVVFWSLAAGITTTVILIKY